VAFVLRRCRLEDSSPIVTLGLEVDLSNVRESATNVKSVSTVEAPYRSNVRNGGGVEELT
jgi:hypothetical protein